MNRIGSTSHKQKGTIGEEAAVLFLKEKGYEILEQNYYYNHGEIDIVAKEKETLIFVEVKSRQSTAFGQPEEFVTPKKQELLRRTAEGYVLEKDIKNIDCRFDVVSVVMNNGKNECKVLKNCF